MAQKTPTLKINKEQSKGIQKKKKKEIQMKSSSEQKNMPSIEEDTERKYNNKERNWAAHISKVHILPMQQLENDEAMATFGKKVVNTAGNFNLVSYKHITSKQKDRNGENSATPISKNICYFKTSENYKY